MRPWIPPVAVFLATLSMAACGYGQVMQGGGVVDPKTLVKATVIGPVRGADGKFQVGVQLKIQPDWHIYWLNPGDAGQQTGLKILAPAGWKVGEWKFPLPVKFEQAGGLVGYGYKDEVTFLTDFTPPEGWTGQTDLKLQLVYLVCEKICIPGQALLTFTADAGGYNGDHGEIATQAIQEAQQKMPVEEPLKASLLGPPLQPGGPLKPYEAALAAGDGGLASAKDIEVFPLPPDNIDVQKIQVAVEGEGAARHPVVRFEAKAYAGQNQLPRNIRLLLVYTNSKDNTGGRVGRWVDLALPSAESK